MVDKTISIIIPVYNFMPIHLELTKNSIKLIRKYTHHPYELIIIDNNSNEETKKYLADIVAFYYPDIRIIRNKENVGIPKAYNQGIKACDGDVFLTQNDMEILEDGWLKKTYDLAYSNKRIGSVGDIVDATPQCGYIGTWCWFIKREAINKIGLFDENFGLGMSDDTDYFRRLLYANYQNRQAPFKFKHLGGKTTGNMGLAQLQEINREYLKKKWEGITWWE